MWDGSLAQELPRSSQPASLEYVATKSKETLLKSSRVEGGDQLLRVVFWAPHAYLNSHTWCAHMHLLTCAKFWVLSPEVQKTIYIGSFDSELSRTHGFSCPLRILLWQPHPCHFVSFVGPTDFLISRMWLVVRAPAVASSSSLSWVFSHELWLTGLAFSLEDLCLSHPSGRSAIFENTYSA